MGRAGYEAVDHLREAWVLLEQGLRQLKFSRRHESGQSRVRGSWQSRGGVDLVRAGSEILNNFGEA